MEIKAFQKTILKWFESHKREMPWRSTNNPYLIWLSEIILQQTRVDQGLRYYIKFAENFPTVYDLASAPEDRILRLWQGLGYYSRARNLHTSAKMIVEEYDGTMPGSFKELLKLKGVGKYTAAAIASIAYGEAVPVVDGNVFRFMSRYFGIHTDIASSPAFAEFFHLASELIPEKQPGNFNQAMMEFGSLQCTPRNPDCETCPLQGGCYAYATNSQELLPVKSKMGKRKSRYFNYVVFSFGDELMVQKRTNQDIWAGMYDFYLIEEKGLLEEDEIARRLQEEAGEYLKSPEINTSETIKHVLSHQDIYARFFRVSFDSYDLWCNFTLDSNLIKTSASELEELPKPVLVSRYLNQTIF